MTVTWNCSGLESRVSELGVVVVVVVTSLK